MDELQDLHHPDIGLLPAALDRGNDLSRAFLRLHLAACAICRHRGFDHGRQGFNHVNGRSAQLVSDRLGKTPEPGFGRAIDGAARARRNCQTRGHIHQRGFGAGPELWHKRRSKPDWRVEVEEDRPVAAVKIDRPVQVVIRTCACIVDNDVNRAARHRICQAGKTAL